MQTCLREIKVYGELANFCGYKSLTADVKTAADAIKCLIGNNPELEPHMCSRYYKVIVEDNPITIEELHHPAGRAPIKIVPVITGEGGRGLGQILLGAALIGLSFVSFGTSKFFSGVGFKTVEGALTITGGLGSRALLYVGASLVLGGISAMLTPLPSIDNSEADPENSFAFSSPINVSRAGIPIPLIYGRRVVGSAVISAGIDIEEVEE
tara:strand:+ start:563 stop:1192 length:630 start_codon:yes stop_codon:yes gene_type:complete